MNRIVTINPHFVRWVLLLSVLMPLRVAQAQNADPTISDDESTSTNDRIEKLEKRIEELEEQRGARADDQVTQEKDERIEKLEQEVASLKENAETSELEHLEELAAEETENRLLEIHGFFDVSFMKIFADEDSIMNGIVPHSSSFTLTHINLYFTSQMTETLSALLELRFTFSPLGSNDFSLGIERIDTTVIDPFSGEEYRTGGVSIERAHLTWQRWEFFAVTAGRFLTPFGIWNIDHGSPVIIPIYPPYMMVCKPMPLSQTGLQVHGRFFPASRNQIEYAFTVSNGRGPTESIYDLDENKGLGLKLKYEYRSPDFSVALGGYGYYGKVTDERSNIASMPPDGPFRVDVETIEKRSELVGSGDFLLRLFGLRIQVEYVRSLTKYEKRPYRTDALLPIQVPPDYQPNHIQWDIYGLLAYEFPIADNTMALTPFVLAEYSVLDDTHPAGVLQVLRWGLNFRPSAYVVIKAIGGLLYMPDSESWGNEPVWYLGSQLAVSF
ncbi:MAG: hypothetical protein GY854_05500 [Deltaproteobacteria bacterium]|nr:hypothetical protein [Deltaproteobacteria bacterium]